MINIIEQEYFFKWLIEVKKYKTKEQLDEINDFDILNELYEEWCEDLKAVFILKLLLGCKDDSRNIWSLL